MEKTIKIAFVSADNPLDKKTWSGSYFNMYTSLVQKGFSVDVLGPVNPLFLKFLHVVNFFSQKIFHKKYNHKHSYIRSYIHGKIIQHRLRKKEYHAIFAPAAATEIAFLKTKIPIIYLSDSSFDQLKDYYDSFKDLFSFSVKESSAIEKKALHKAQVIIYPSQWAKDFTVNHYNINPEKIHIIPFGSNLNIDYDLAIDKKNKDVFNILFVGVDWERKGGEIVYRVFKQLLEQNYKVTLTVVGCVPPYTHDKMAVYPFLDKNIEKDLKQLSILYHTTHVLFVPSKAECFGIVYCEASAYGIPSIARNTGGVPHAVIDQVNGYLFAYEAAAEEYFKKITYLINNPDAYKNLCQSAQEMYKKELNWASWAGAMATHINKLA